MEKDLETIFLTTVEANKDRMFRICRSYSTDADDAKNLFQEVLINKATGVKCYMIIRNLA